MENFDAIIETAEQEQNPERLSTEKYAAMKNRSARNFTPPLMKRQIRFYPTPAL